MSEHVNLPPGMPAPVSGDYKCIFCAMRSVFGGGSVPTVDNMRSIGLGRSDGTVKHFTQGEQLTECQLCGDATGWSLLD